MKSIKQLFAATAVLAGLINMNTNVAADPLGTAFTYQGRLNSGGAPANGLYDLQFHLSDALINGNQIVQPITNSAVAVSNGLFTVSLDFGSALYGDQATFLWISVRTNGNGAFTDLTPRQPLTPTPYALYAKTSGAASTANVASSVASGGISSAAIQTDAVNSSGIADGTIAAADLSYAVASNTFWRLNGNAGTTASQFIGTTDNQALNFNVNNHRVMRLDPGTNGVPNVLGGYELNRITAGIKGATIAGGGGPSQWNAVTNGDFGTIGGGLRNQSGADYATIAGGRENIATGDSSTVAGGGFNRATGFANAVSGGFNNTAAGVYSFIGGGIGNSNSASCSVTVGGTANTNYGAYSTIGGGRNNSAGNLSSTIPGGAENEASGSYTFAAGQRAKALHTGVFVWAD
ncbi:MAG TPA: hypothetical protein VK327_08810, partial [Candidatus Paceibacterota bacterium]|nr:hypothetical protein [Candidatus Paceibacterota bacterium]